MLAALYDEPGAQAVMDSLETLADDPTVNGIVIDLDTVQDTDQPTPEFALRQAYEAWDEDTAAELRNPQTANRVAQTIKHYLYDIIPAYENLKYIVLVGGDEVIPYRRVVDNTLVANQRNYQTALDPAISAAYQNRYLLTDDYYSAVLPLSAFGRELYLPQFAIGRLVEKPDEIINMIDVYQAGNETIEPQDALITGYDFLIDQATAISEELNARGVTQQTTLIDNQWRGPDFRGEVLVGQTEGEQHFDLISLNSHFDHRLFFPNGSPSEALNLVYADELDDNVNNNFVGTLVFSVGCQSGLNVSDRWYQPGTPFTGADWAQMFAREGAAFIGNTGFGYGDVDLLAYSERLMFNFVRQLGYDGAGVPSVGGALLEAKQQYFNEKAAGTLSAYDEKLLAEMTLYGLPMQKVQLPDQTNVEPDGTSADVAPTGPAQPVVAAVAAADAAVLVGPAPAAPIPGLTQTPLNLDITYTQETYSRGSYYRVNGGTTLESGERPVLPLTTISRDSADMVARGVLMLGGTFNDTPGFDPVIIGIVPEDSESLPANELRFDIPQWYTLMPASISRFWDVDEKLYSQDVVVVPGQFHATSNSGDPKTVGIMRLYSELDILVYEGPGEQPDYKSPGIWQVDAVNGGDLTLTFNALVQDSAASVKAPATGVLRVVVLYRHVSQNSWTAVDLAYNPATLLATQSVNVPQPGIYEYFVQAVDNAGNVSPVLDHGNYFSVEATEEVQPTDRTIYVTARSGGTVDGVAFTDRDILAYSPEEDEWTMFFDASDVGFGSNLSAFALLEDGGVLLAPRSQINLPTLGLVDPHDIIRFIPTTTGENTAGSFSWFLDGSDVGLTRDVEIITSIGFTPEGRLVISTSGNTSVPGANGGVLNVGPDDLIMFMANSYGQGTSGFWEHYLDGAAIGLDANRVFAHWIDPATGDVYLTPQAAVTLGGLPIDQNDVALCVPQNSGPITSCDYTRYWDGAEHRFGSYAIDSLDLGQVSPFDPPTGSITIVKAVTSGSGSFSFNGDLGTFGLTVPGDTSQQFPNQETGAYLVREIIPSGWDIQSVVCDDPDDGTTVVGAGQVLIDLDDDETITCTFTNAPDAQPSNDIIFVSASANGSVGGVSFTNGDILRYDGSTWSMYFDGSDVGVSTVKAFTLLPNGSLLLGLGKAATLPGVGKVAAQDIVRFTPTSTGNITAGSFQWYFDGSDVAISTAGEAIDALSIDGAGKLVISVRGAAVVSRPGTSPIRAADEDLMSFTFSSSGVSTSGAWTWLFDGSDVGLKDEDIDALWIDPVNGELYLSVENTFSVNGASGGGGTIFVCDPGTTGATTTCTYRPYWNAAAAGLSLNVDGVFIER